jgi:hypothetical protein
MCGALLFVESAKPNNWQAKEQGYFGWLYGGHPRPGRSLSKPHLRRSRGVTPRLRALESMWADCVGTPRQRAGLCVQPYRKVA